MNLLAALRAASLRTVATPSLNPAAALARQAARLRRMKARRVRRRSRT